MGAEVLLDRISCSSREGARRTTPRDVESPTSTLRLVDWTSHLRRRPGLACERKRPVVREVVKGPYLQALASTSVEIRAELDTPAPISNPHRSDCRRRSRTQRARRRPEPDAVVRVNGLLPSTRYRIRLAVGSNLAQGTFTTAPPADSTARFTFLVYGDNRTDDTAHAAIVRLMTETPSDFLINTGDLVQDGASAANWQSFFGIEASLIRDRNVFACVGNHEITTPRAPTTSGTSARPPTRTAWVRLRSSMARSAGAKRASSCSTRWRRSKTAPSARGWTTSSRAPTRRPASSGGSSSSTTPPGRPARTGETLARSARGSRRSSLRTTSISVIAGHDHIYERGFASVVHRAGLGSDALSGIRYIVSGGGGAPLYQVDHPLASTRKVEAVHHVVEVTVQSDAVRLLARRDDGSIIERCGMTKAHDGWDCDPLTPSPAGPLPSSPSPSSSRWGCSASAASPSLTPALVALGFVGLRWRRRRNPR